MVHMMRLSSHIFVHYATKSCGGARPEELALWERSTYEGGMY